MPHPTWQEATVTVAGTAVHVYCGGEGPPLLLLHSGEGNPGWLMHHTAFAEPFCVYAHTSGLRTEPPPRLPFLLPRLTCPTLIVWGRHDAMIPLECGEMYQCAIANARLEILDACGHWPPLERPQAFVDVVRSFLRAETRP